MELTHEHICFAIDGYISDIKTWLDRAIAHFGAKNYLLKSVSYDVNHERFETKSLKLFLEKLPQEKNIDKLFSFSVFFADNQKYPDTWHYGIWYDMDSRLLCMFFDKAYGEENILSFYQFAIEQLLSEKKVDGGYLFYANSEYSLGGDRTKSNLYKENGQKWWEILNPRNRHIYFNLGNRYRHIYLQNILSQEHYDEMIDDMSLTEWINKYSCGSIQKIGMKNWLWKVPCEKLNEIGVIFYNKGVLLGVD